jgi:hypothetical protein
LEELVFGEEAKLRDMLEHQTDAKSSHLWLSLLRKTFVDAPNVVL